MGGILMKVVMNSVRGDTSEGITKLLSAACIACWFGGVITGRLMAYV